jgi:hypothetical protein
MFQNTDYLDGPRMRMLRDAGRSDRTKADAAAKALEQKTFGNFMDTLPGFRYIVVNPDDAPDDSCLVYKGQRVVAFVCVHPAAISALEHASVLGLDGSFNDCKPLDCWGMPMAIIQNMGVPICLFAGPTESCRLFEHMKEAVDSAADQSGFAIPTWPNILADMGQGIAAFARAHNLLVHHCHFHKIRICSGNPIAGAYMREALQIEVSEEWERRRDMIKDDIDYMKDAGLLPEADKVLRHLGWRKDAGVWGEFEDALFNRPPEVPTCNNHEEGNHRWCHHEMRQFDPPVVRFEKLYTRMDSLVAKFTDERHKAKVAKMSKETAAKFQGCDVCACAQAQRSAGLWGIQPGICRHMAVPDNLEIAPLPTLARFDDFPAPMVVEDTTMWTSEPPSEDEFVKETPPLGSDHLHYRLVRLVKILGEIDDHYWRGKISPNARFFSERGGENAIASNLRLILAQQFGVNSIQTVDDEVKFRRFCRETMAKATSQHGLEEYRL